LAWGFNNKGQVGDETINNQSSPVQIGALTDWASMASSANRYFNVAIKTDGTMWSWGYNGIGGQLGLGDGNNRSSPTQIGALTDWSDATGGGYFAVAVKTDNTLWTWGRNNQGQLGDETGINRSSPVQLGSLIDWSKITAGQYVGLIIKTDGSLWTWGRNDSGQLGLNDVNINRSSPVQIGSDTDWATVSGGRKFVLATKTDGTAWAWGEGGNGQTGLISSADRSSPTQIGALTDWASVHAGPFHSFAIKTNGELWAWGRNSVAGALGDGTTINRNSPVQIGSLTDWSSATAGGNIGAAIKTDGTIWTWGQNNHGQLGQGNTIYYSSPVQVGSATDWSLMDAGYRHITALRNS